jgi:hypothetical protein
MNAYEQGFNSKCLEFGINAELLIKQAARFYRFGKLVEGTPAGHSPMGGGASSKLKVPDKVVKPAIKSEALENISNIQGYGSPVRKPGVPGFQDYN